MFFKTVTLLAVIYSAQAFTLRDSSLVEELIENAEELRNAVIEEQAKLNEVKQRINFELQQELIKDVNRITSHSHQVYERIQNISPQKEECMINAWNNLQMILMESSTEMTLCYSTATLKLTEIQSDYIVTTNSMLENMYSAVQAARLCGDDNNCIAMEVGKYVGLNIKMLKTIEDLKKQMRRQSAKNCLTAQFNNGSKNMDEVYQNVETCTKQ